MRNLREWWSYNGGNLIDCLLVLVQFAVVCTFAGLFFWAMTS